jgi:hypothetical protein
MSSLRACCKSSHEKELPTLKTADGMAGARRRVLSGSLVKRFFVARVDLTLEEGRSQVSPVVTNVLLEFSFAPTSLASPLNIRISHTREVICKKSKRLDMPIPGTIIPVISVVACGVK